MKCKPEVDKDLKTIRVKLGGTQSPTYKIISSTAKHHIGGRKITMNDIDEMHLCDFDANHGHESI